MASIVSCRLITLLSLTGLPLSLMAHHPTLTEPDGARLDTVTVQAPDSRGLAATADDKLEDFFRASRAQSLLDSERWREGRAGNQEDAFKRVPGVWVSSENNGDDVALSIRGSGISSSSFGRGVRSYQDGIILGSLDGGTTNQLVDMLAYDHLEVYRGPAALALGAATTGGVINYISRTGRNTPGWLVRSEAGRFGYRRNQLAHGGQDGDLDHFVSINHTWQEGFRDQQRQNNLRLNANLGVQLRDDIENRTYLMVTEANTELAGGIPLHTLNRDTRRQAAANNVQYDADRNWQDLRLANRAQWQMDDRQRLTSSAFVTRSRLDHLPTPFVGIIDNELESYGVGLDYALEQDAGHTLVAGVRAGQGSDRLARFQQTPDGQRKGNQTYDARLRTLQLEAYAEQTWQVSERWRLNLGAQALHSRRALDDYIREAPPPCAECLPFPQPQANPDDISYRVTYQGLSPKAGATFEWTPGQLVFAQLARSIEGAASSELGNNPIPGSLDAQTALTAELGTRGMLSRGYWELVLYHTRIEDEILNLDLDGATGIFNARGDTVHRGIELGTGLHLHEDLMLETVYNLSDFRFDDDPDFGNSRLPTIPRHTLFMSLRYSTPSGLVIAPNGRYVSGYDLTYSNTGGSDWQAPSHTLWGLVVSQEFANGLRLFAEGQNLTDEVYVASASAVVAPNPMATSGNVNPGGPRAWYAGFEYRF